MRAGSYLNLFTLPWFVLVGLALMPLQGQAQGEFDLWSEQEEPTQQEDAADQESSNEDAGESDFGFGFAPEPEPEPIPPYRYVVGEFGMLTRSEDSAQLSRFNGLDLAREYLISDIEFARGASEESAYYWRGQLQQLSFPNRRVDLLWGKAGRFKQTLVYDESTFIEANTGVTPFRLDDGVLRLPGGWQAGATTGAFTNLGQTQYRVFEEQTRQRLSLTHEYRLNPRWTLTGAFTTEQRDGVQSRGAAFYTTAADPRAAILPAPVSETQDQIRLGARYQQGALNLKGYYQLLHYDNQRERLAWQNPYDNVFGAAVDYPAGEGAFAQAPDNQTHQLRWEGGYQFRQATHLQWLAQWSRTYQDDPFLPYTTNDALAVTNPLPREDLDGQVDQWVGQMVLWHQVNAKLRLQARWRWHEYDNQTPRDLYAYVPGDAADQVQMALALYNRPTEFHKQSAELSAHYRLPMRSRVSVSYQYKEVERFNRATEETQEDQVEVILRSRFAKAWYSKLGFTFSDRAASLYQWDQSLLALWTSEAINALPDNQRYLNHPLLKQHDISNRETQAWNWRLQYTPSVQWQWALQTRWQWRDYDKSYLGLNEHQQSQIALQGSYMPKQDFTAYGYMHLGSLLDEQWGRQFRGGADKAYDDTSLPLAEASDRRRDWQVESDDRNYVVGGGFSWEVVPQKWQFDFEYSYVYTNTELDVTTLGAADITVLDLPKVTTRYYSVEPGLTYRFDRTNSLIFGYRFERYLQQDFAYNQVEPTTLKDVLLLGEGESDEHVHTISVALRVEFE